MGISLAIVTVPATRLDFSRGHFRNAAVEIVFIVVFLILFDMETSNGRNFQRT